MTDSSKDTGHSEQKKLSFAERSREIRILISDKVRQDVNGDHLPELVGEIAKLLMELSPLDGVTDDEIYDAAKSIYEYYNLSWKDTQSRFSYESNSNEYLAEVLGLSREIHNHIKKPRS